jgi:Zn-dependent oligopeptidase
MTEANLSGTALPAFDSIRAGDVETTIRGLLERNRGEVAALESQPAPTFANTVLPLEQLSHRLSRTWSPISHLNGVLNSDELRASYNACLPLLSNYWTDLAQSEPLFRAYSAIAANEADRLDTAWDLTTSSRLGCQAVITGDVVAEFPLYTRNYVQEGGAIQLGKPERREQDGEARP